MDSLDLVGSSDPTMNEFIGSDRIIEHKREFLASDPTEPYSPNRDTGFIDPDWLLGSNGII